MNVTKPVALSALLTELKALTEDPLPSYRQVYNMILDGRLSAQRVNGRWFLPRADLPGIAFKLGLKLKQQSVATKVRKHSSTLSAKAALDAEAVQQDVGRNAAP